MSIHDLQERDVVPRPGMTLCKVCRAEISRTARACPKCGHQILWNQPGRLGCQIASVLIFALLAWAFYELMTFLDSIKD